MSTPEKLDYEQRRVGDNRFDSVPRRCSEKRFFKHLTGKQRDALDEIEEAHTYEGAGLPIPRMRFDDKPRGSMEYELTPRQLQLVIHYKEWYKHLYSEMRPVYYAIFNYIDGKTPNEIDRALRIKNGKATRYLSIALNEFCIVRGMGNQLSPEAMSRTRITGRTAEIDRYVTTATGFDQTGKPYVFVEKNTPPE